MNFASRKPITSRSHSEITQNGNPVLRDALKTESPWLTRATQEPDLNLVWSLSRPKTRLRPRDFAEHNLKSSVAHNPCSLNPGGPATRCAPSANVGVPIPQAIASFYMTPEWRFSRMTVIPNTLPFVPLYAPVETRPA